MRILALTLIAIFCFTSCNDSQNPTNSQTSSVENDIYEHGGTDTDLEDLANENSYRPDPINTNNNNHTNVESLPKCPARANVNLVLPTKAPKPPYKHITNEHYSWQWYLGNINNMYDTFKNQYPDNPIDNDAHIHTGDHLNYYRGKGVKIAIIDDGLDVNHPDLQGQLQGTYSILTGGTDVSPYDKNAHATNVTGIIAAKHGGKLYGIANESEVFFIKLRAANSNHDFVKVFKKAHEFGADIINNSWGASNYDIVQDVIRDLAENGRGCKGTLIVFASGNTNSIINDEASNKEVIAVGATDHTNKRAPYSNYGSNLYVMAPGGVLQGTKLAIRTTNPHISLEMRTCQYNSTGNCIDYRTNRSVAVGQRYQKVVKDKLYNEVTGTSFAAPIVSGVLALALEANPELTLEQVKYLLRKTSDKVGDMAYDGNGHSHYYGYGKINVQKLLDAAIGGIND